eukprot:TRINITY_DN87215_c0_g1_i1.p1 TRINITY_DN87215_c0_g1~~TRINITY_DN87215_c0_g1_i1.p1  ORF type:complete len:447 (-),score=222.76 TRINITY_DN87215_c0_g1_i1:32-1372(-)
MKALLTATILLQLLLLAATMTTVVVAGGALDEFLEEQLRDATQNAEDLQSSSITEQRMIVESYGWHDDIQLRAVDAVMSRFAPDSVLELDGYATYHGHARIKEFWVSLFRKTRHIRWDVLTPVYSGKQNEIAYVVSSHMFGTKGCTSNAVIMVVVEYATPKLMTKVHLTMSKSMPTMVKDMDCLQSTHNQEQSAAEAVADTHDTDADSAEHEHGDEESHEDDPSVYDDNPEAALEQKTLLGDGKHNHDLHVPDAPGAIPSDDADAMLEGLRADDDSAVDEPHAHSHSMSSHDVVDATHNAAFLLETLDIESVVSTYATDAVIEIAGYERLEGRDQVRDYFTQFIKDLKLLTFSDSIPFGVWSAEQRSNTAFYFRSVTLGTTTGCFSGFTAIERLHFNDDSSISRHVWFWSRPREHVILELTQCRPSTEHSALERAAELLRSLHDEL